MQERKALLILHGKQALNQDVRAAVEAKREQGWELAVRLTWEPGDAQRLVTEALHAGYSTLIAGGGDGTLRDIAEAVAKADGDSSLALLPLGTANDFARCAGISQVPAEALALLDTPPTAIDLGEVDGELFLNMATGGFGSAVTANTSEQLKRVLGGAAYMLTGLSRFAEVHSAFARFSGPDFVWEGEFLAFGVGNGRQAGGGHLLCPAARVDDGLLNVSIVPAAQDVVRSLGTLLSGGVKGIDGVAISACLPWLQIEAPQELHLNLDGEPRSARCMDFAVRPAALRVHLPLDSVLLSR